MNTDKSPMDAVCEHPALQQAAGLLETLALATAVPGPDRLDVTLDAADLTTAVQRLAAAGWGYLAAITGLDLGAEAAALEVLYHLCEGAAVLTLRVRLDAGAPAVASVHLTYPYAGIYERELHEMFGIDVIGTPDTSHLFLPDDWPDGIYPLRKTFEAAQATAVAGRSPEDQRASS